MKNDYYESRLESLYKDRLESLYKEYYGNGGCPFFDECEKGISKSCTFRFDKAKVGEKYGENSEIPKIVFVGLEGLNEHQGIEKPETDKCYNPHYKGVRYVLAYLLSSYFSKERPDSVLKECLKDYVETMEYFALLNCYKCAFGDKPKGRPHSEAMRVNCQEILFREIEALEPDIVVFQVKDESKRPNDFVKNLEKNFGEKNPIYGNTESENTDTGAYWYTLPSGKRFIWIWTYHGAGRTHSQKQGWASNDISGKDYREKDLDPVLNAVLDAMRQLNLSENSAGNE